MGRLQHGRSAKERDGEEASELSMKAETFSHYSYKKSNTQLMVLDIQGVGYTLCDPEIAPTTHMDEAALSHFRGLTGSSAFCDFSYSRNLI